MNRLWRAMSGNGSPILYWVLDAVFAAIKSNNDYT